MDPQPLQPTPITPVSPAASLPPLPSGPGLFNGRNNNPNPFTFILLAVLGVGMLIFIILTLVFYGKATTATKTLNAQKAAAAAKAKTDQKKADDEATALAAESPFRSYIAPEEDGSFEIKFPKDWSSYVDQENTGTQVSLIVNPDFIRRTNGNDELAAARIQLIERSSDQYMQTFSGSIKRNILKQTDTSVSGQRGYDLSGKFSDNKTTREVVIPVRDKVLVFINENGKYAAEFNEILAQSKIIP